MTFSILVVVIGIPVPVYQCVLLPRIFIVKKLFNLYQIFI